MAPPRATDERSGVARRVTLRGLVANVALAVAKYVAGFLGNSNAMIADATHSVSDLVTDIAVLFSFYIADKPPDRHHSYGHGKVETLAAAFCGSFLFLAALGILVPACLDIYHFAFSGRTGEPPGRVALYAALLSIAVKEGLYRYTVTAGKILESPALIANAWHHRSDAFSSIGTALGIGGAVLGGPRFAVLDPIAAAVVSVFIFKAAWSIIAESGQELIEASIGAEGVRAIREIVESQGGVLGYHALKSRRIGCYIAIEAHVLVDRKLTIVQAHDIATALEWRLRHEFGRRTHINIHVEPFEENHQDPQTDVRADGLRSHARAQSAATAPDRHSETGRL